MNPSRANSIFLSHLALVAAVVSAMIPSCARGQDSAGKWHEVSLAEYSSHLGSLDNVVATCQKLRTTQACDPGQVGADDRVLLPVKGGSIKRDVRYDWLRALLLQGGQPEVPATEKAAPGQVIKTPAPSVNEKLLLARERLKADAKQAESFAPANQNYDAEHKALSAILARKEFRGVTEVTARERFQEWLGNEIDAILDHLANFGRRSPWIGVVLRALVFVAIAVGLMWALVRIERRSRTRLIPEVQPVVGAPSAREWQLWRADALEMAKEGRWREAIHFLYWAAISHLESRHVWAADRARTPREYLQLVPASDARKSSLATLTRSFERTWYGGRDASSTDFHAAQKLAAELGVE
jgi:hypothetical protein